MPLAPVVPTLPSPGRGRGRSPTGGPHRRQATRPPAVGHAGAPAGPATRPQRQSPQPPLFLGCRLHGRRHPPPAARRTGAAAGRRAVRRARGDPPPGQPLGDPAFDAVTASVGGLLLRPTGDRTGEQVRSRERPGRRRRARHPVALLALLLGTATGAAPTRRTVDLGRPERTATHRPSSCWSGPPGAGNRLLPRRAVRLRVKPGRVDQPGGRGGPPAGSRHDGAHRRDKSEPRTPTPSSRPTAPSPRSSATGTALQRLAGNYTIMLFQGGARCPAAPPAGRCTVAPGSDRPAAAVLARRGHRPGAAARRSTTSRGRTTRASAFDW